MLDSNNRYFDIGSFTGTGVYDADAFNYNRDTSVPEAIPGQRYYALYSFTYKGRLITKAIKSRTYNSRELEVLAGMQCAVYHDEADLSNCVCKKLPPEYVDAIVPHNEPMDAEPVAAPAPEEVAQPEAPVPEQFVIPPLPSLSEQPIAPEPPASVVEPELVEVPAEPAPAPHKKKKKLKKKAPEITYAKGVFAELQNGLFMKGNKRVCRREYFVCSTIMMIPVALVSLVCLIPSANGATVSLGLTLVGIASIIAAIVNIILAMSRWRDMSKPGALGLLQLIPIVSTFASLACLILKGDDGENASGPDHRQFYTGSGIFKGIVIWIICSAMISASISLGALNTIKSLIGDKFPMLNMGSPAEEESFDDYDWDVGTEEDTWVDEEPIEDFTDDTGATETFEDAWADPDSSVTSESWDWESDQPAVDTTSSDSIEGSDGTEFVTGDEQTEATEENYDDIDFLQTAGEESDIDTIAEENNIEIQEEESDSIE